MIIFIASRTVRIEWRARSLLITINLVLRMKTDQAVVTKLLQQWDHGSKSVRSKILQDFIKSNHGKTGPELELEFAHAASLFLTRLTAWLRLTYPFHVCSDSHCLKRRAKVSSIPWKRVYSQASDKWSLILLCTYHWLSRGLTPRTPLGICFNDQAKTY